MLDAQVKNRVLAKSPTGRSFDPFLGLSHPQQRRRAYSVHLLPSQLFSTSVVRWISQQLAISHRLFREHKMQSWSKETSDKKTGEYTNCKYHVPVLYYVFVMMLYPTYAAACTMTSQPSQITHLDLRAYLIALSEYEIEFIRSSTTIV
jgi:hypothetical protein